MLLLKYLLLGGGVALIVTSVIVAMADAQRMWGSEEMLMRRRRALTLVAGGCMMILAALSFVIVPSGMAAVRVSQLSGTLGGTLYPGMHLIMPLIQRVEVFNVRDQMFTTSPTETPKQTEPVLKVYSKEGLPLGLGVSVRYQLDPQRLPYLQSTLPQPVETEIMPAVVANAFRQTVATYMVRDVFSARREEVRRLAADSITKKLAPDGIVVKEVMLRDIELPSEYAKGLESLLLKEQENDRMGVETEIHQKQVKVAEADAEEIGRAHV